MLSKKKLLSYLEWLSENQKYNAEERERYGSDSRVNRECQRVADMLIEQINNGDFNIEVK